MPAGSAHLPAERVGAPRAGAPRRRARTAAFVEEALRWLPATDRRRRRAAPSGAAGADGARGARILVADDNADMRDYVGAPARASAGPSRRSATARAALGGARGAAARPRRSPTS